MPRHLIFVLLVVIAVGYEVLPGHSEAVGVRARAEADAGRGASGAWRHICRPADS